MFSLRVLQYAVMYGVALASMEVDGFSAAVVPRFPVCFYACSSPPSHIWRYFDHGLYVFLSEYIYKPVGALLGERGLLRLPRPLLRLVPVGCTFVYVWVWHGLSFKIGTPSPSSPSSPAYIALLAIHLKFCTYR